MGIHTGNDNHVMIEDNIQGLDGYISLTANDNVRTLGLQNFYGHVGSFLHNVIVRLARKVWIKKDFTNADTWPTYSNAIANGWEELSVALPGDANGRWISEISWNSSEPWAIYPSKFGGNDVEPIGDACWNDTYDPFSVIRVGGDSWAGGYGGTMCWASYNQLSFAAVYSGGRSLEIIL